MRRSARWLAAPCRAGLALIVALALTPSPAGTKTGSTPDDPVFAQGLQWGLERIGAPGAWARGTGDGVTIAVVDSGVDLRHEDLAPKVAGDVSCIGSGGNPAACAGSGQDDDGHGTHVAGIAAAATGNGRGVAGVAPDSGLLAVRVLANSCDGSGPCTATGSADDVAAGIRWATDHGADVINLSLGGGTLRGDTGCAFCDAVEYAWSHGAIAVIAAGNDSIVPVGFGDEHAVVVTATNRADARASYGDAGSGLPGTARWPVAAPGGEAETDPDDCATSGTPKGILSSHWVSGQADSYACLAGTSMAAPHVAGALAVLLSTGLDPPTAIDQLLATAQDLGAPGRDDEFGMGRVDLGRAVGATPDGTSSRSPTPTPATSVQPATPPRGATTTMPALSLPGVAEPARSRPMTRRATMSRRRGSWHWPSRPWSPAAAPLRQWPGRSPSAGAPCADPSPAGPTVAPHHLPPTKRGLRWPPPVPPPPSGTDPSSRALAASSSSRRDWVASTSPGRRVPRSQPAARAPRS